MSGLPLVSAARDEFSSVSILVASCLYLLPKQREVKVAPIGRRKTDIYLLPEQLDVQAGTLHLPALSVVRTVLTQEQADYFGVKVEGTLNDGHCRY